MQFSAQLALSLRMVGAALAAGAILALGAPLDGCTRVLYTGDQEMVVTGRSMDWEEDMHSNIWVFPRGIERNGSVDAHSPVWTAKYGSLIVSGYDIGTADGMNEQGLVANVLYLGESDYGSPAADKPLLSISLWGQYVLDNFASVSEAVDALRQEPFGIVAPVLPNGAPAQLHLSLSDAAGDSAILEYIGGKLVIHHGKQYKVMTNSPSFDQQLALNSYWQDIGGLKFLPGTNRAADRFARASFFIEGAPNKIDPSIISAVPGQQYAYQAVAVVLSIVRSVSVPLGISTPDQPNIASTLWRVVADQKNKVYYFDSATTPNTFWLQLADLDFKEGAPILELKIAGGRFYAGNAGSSLEKSAPFVFLPAHRP
jgi:choloylglycine hydrolase